VRAYDFERQGVPEYRLSIVRSPAYRAIIDAWSEPVLLACSGGVDSSALLVLAREALRRYSIVPVAVTQRAYELDVASSTDWAARRAGRL
jgi:3'-phosphoadenosine 5'-phosphosulfate sulfotransferase (PAPS reductase)/FAD synthetase